MQNSIRKVLSKLRFRSYLHYKFFEEVIEVLVSDKDKYLNNKGNIYEFLGGKIHKEPETIKTKIKTINNNFDREQYNLLGFNEKPKNTELLDRLVELSKNEKLQKVETLNEHERKDSK
jgi:hypothetical protein